MKILCNENASGRHLNSNTNSHDFVKRGRPPNKETKELKNKLTIFIIKNINH